MASLSYFNTDFIYHARIKHRITEMLFCLIVTCRNHAAIQGNIAIAILALLIRGETNIDFKIHKVIFSNKDHADTQRTVDQFVENSDAGKG